MCSKATSARCDADQSDAQARGYSCDVGHNAEVSSDVSADVPADVPTGASSAVRKVLLGTVTFDLSKVSWRRSVIATLVTVVVLVICMSNGRPAHAVPLVLGALFVPLAGSGEPRPRRIITQAWTLAWLMLGTLLGALVVDGRIVVVTIGILITGLLAFAGGFAGAAGRNSRLSGMLLLVTFAIFMGSPDTPLLAVQTCALLGLGGLIALVIDNLLDLMTSRSHESVWVLEPLSMRERLRSHPHSRDDYVRHGVRLAGAMMVGTALSQALPWPHQYWIPMTVAWVSMPNSDGTVNRVAARVAGTFAGVALVEIVFTFVPVSHVMIAGLLGAGALLVFAFITANYASAVAGVTVLVMALFAAIGDPVTSTLPYRVIDTLIAAALVVAFAALWPSAKSQS